MTFRRIFVITLSALCILCMIFFIYNFRHNEYKLKMNVNPNYATTIGKSFESYDRETINIWLTSIKNAEKVANKQFNAKDAVAGLKIYQETGSVYYLSNIYIDDEYLYISDFNNRDRFVRLEIIDFKNMDKKKANAIDYLKFNLNMPLVDIDFE